MGIVYSDYYPMIDNNHTNGILGICIPSIHPEYMLDNFLHSLPNMVELNRISTISINCQGQWTKDQMSKAIDMCHENGFPVAISYNNYEFTNHEVPITRIREDSATLVKDSLIFLSLDDDHKILGPSPKINKSGGQQYLEIVKYMIDHDKCGVVSTTGVIGRHPPKDFIGPNSRVGLNMYIMTGLGLFLKNMRKYTNYIGDSSNTELGLMMPPDSLWIKGALEDALSAAYRYSNGFYPAKRNYVRVKYDGATPINGENKDTTGWARDELLNNNVVKYIREHWSPSYEVKINGPRYVDYNYYVDHGGLYVYDEKLCDKLTDDYSNSTITADDVISSVIPKLERLNIINKIK
jgi:hypothetical protein